MQPKQTHLILNPMSAGGRTGRKQQSIINEVGRRLKGDLSVCVTKAPLEATTSTRTAIQQGAELIVAVGGDGTIQEVVNGFFLNGTILNPSCQLGIICSGTGADVGKSFEIPQGLAEQIEDVCGSDARRIDIGKVTYTDAAGLGAERFFINECQQGIAAVVVQGVRKQRKRLGGFLGFGLAAVRTAATFREKWMTVKIDDREPISGQFLGIAAANGKYAGGGMNFAPRAKVDDGLLDIVLIHKQWIPTRLANFPKIYSGRHINLPWVSYFQAKHVSVTSEEKVTIEADGELLGFVPCRIEIVPRPLQLKSSWRRGDG